MKNKFAFAILVSFQLAALAHAESAHANGSCQLGDKRVDMVRIEGAEPLQTIWKATLGQGIEAKVSFRPGYGMTFVTLALIENGATAASSTLMKSGYVTGDSVASDANENTMQHFEALSLKATLSGGAISCSYGFYPEKL